LPGPCIQKALPIKEQKPANIKNKTTRERHIGKRRTMPEGGFEEVVLIN